MSNISLTASAANISESLFGTPISLKMMNRLSSSVTDTDLGITLTDTQKTIIGDFTKFNKANSTHPILESATQSLNSFNSYDHYENFDYGTGSAFAGSDNDESPDVALAETYYGVSNIGHNPQHWGGVVLSSSGQPAIIAGYREHTSNNHSFCIHGLNGFDSNSFDNGGDGGTGSYTRLTVGETGLGVTNGSGVAIHPIESHSVLVLSRDQSFSGKTRGQFIDVFGNVSALTNVHTAKTNNTLLIPYTNFSQSAVAFMIGRGNMEVKHHCVRKNGTTLSAHGQAEPAVPSGYSGTSTGTHGVLQAYRSGSDNGTIKKFFDARFHAFGGFYKMNTLFFAQVEFNSATNAWSSISAGDWTLVNEDWKSQTSIKGSSNVGDFVGKAPNGDDWVVWFSLMGEGNPPDGQTYCHSARITQADSVTITDISEQMGLSELTGSRRYLNTQSTNAGGRCWQDFRVIGNKGPYTEFVLHFNSTTAPVAHSAYYNFDLRNGNLTLIAEVTSSTRDTEAVNGGMCLRWYNIPKEGQWNARDLYRLDGDDRHFVQEYSHNVTNVSKSAWIRNIHLKTR